VQGQTEMEVGGVVSRSPNQELLDKIVSSY